MQRTTWLAAIGTGLLIGCSPTQQSLPYAPVFNTGARATIISPGQNAPLMGAAPRSASGSSGQGSSSSSSSSGGYPGQAYGAPPPGTPPSAYPSQGEFTSLGGALTVDTREIEQPRGSLRSNPILWPLGVVAWPFQKVAEAVTGSGDQESDRDKLARRAEAIVASGGGPINEGPAQAQQDHERNEVEAMQRELERRQGGSAAREGGASQQVATAQTSGGGTLSIADELAALRNRAPRASAAPAMSGTPSPGPVAGADGAKDRDGDGRADHWVIEADGDKTREVFDDDYDGRPDRTVYYAPGGEQIVRIEQDSDGDGAPDSWVLYENGKLAQRRADTNQDGQVDSWTFYDERGQIIRQAADLDGDGTRDRAELFENGKLARRTEDLDGDGQPDRITRFDAQGNQTELEEDKDGDGQIDVKSFYSDGRLVKRQILDGETAEGATP